MNGDNEQAFHDVPTECFLFSKRRRLTFLVIGLLLGVFGIFCLYVGFVSPDEVSSPRARMQARIMGPIICPVSGFLLFTALRKRQLLAKTDQRGLSLTCGEQHHECHWEEISFVRELGLEFTGTLYPFLAAFPHGKEHQFIVECYDGRVLTFTNLLGNLRRLGTIIEHATLPHLLPAAKTAFEASGSFDAGPFVVGNQGLQFDQDSDEEFIFGYENIGEIKREKGHIAFKKANLKKALGMVVNDDSPVVSTNELPNPHIAIALIQMCRQSS